jgi:hypothetical protein
MRPQEVFSNTLGGGLQEWEDLRDFCQVSLKSCVGWVEASGADTHPFNFLIQALSDLEKTCATNRD